MGAVSALIADQLATARKAAGLQPLNGQRWSPDDSKSTSPEPANSRFWKQQQQKLEPLHQQRKSLATFSLRQDGESGFELTPASFPTPVEQDDVAPLKSARRWVPEVAAPYSPGADSFATTIEGRASLLSGAPTSAGAATADETYRPASWRRLPGNRPLSHDGVSPRTLEVPGGPHTPALTPPLAPGAGRGLQLFNRLGAQQKAAESTRARRASGNLGPAQLAHDTRPSISVFSTSSDEASPPPPTPKSSRLSRPKSAGGMRSLAHASFFGRRISPSEVPLREAREKGKAARPHERSLPPRPHSQGRNSEGRLAAEHIPPVPVLHAAPAAGGKRLSWRRRSDASQI
jgi:hypothetical protein